MVELRAGGLFALVNLGACGDELRRLLFHAGCEGGFIIQLLLRGEVSDLLRDLHRTKMRAAHGAEVRELRALLRESFVVKLARDFGVEREVELVLPAELEARLRERVVVQLRPRVP